MTSLPLISSPYEISVFGLLICVCMMIATWIWAQSKSFLSVVDAVWAFGIGGISALYCFLFGKLFLEKIVAVGFAVVWSIRLGSHLTRRLGRHFPQEDRRYDELRSRWKGSMASKSFVFFLFQALTQCFFAFPFASLAASTEGLVSSYFWLGACVAAIGLAGESFADAQLKNFVAKPGNQGLVCNHRLWHYSRHPNYFFEWIVWCGFGVMGAAAPSGWFSIACPCVMLILLLFVTGVPPAEASSLKSKGQLYRNYQDTTSKFVPWFPKSGGQHSQEAS
jgi:steroid 5-alpha reductase family enzyme